MAVTANFSGVAVQTDNANRFRMLQSMARSHQGAPQNVPDSSPTPLALNTKDFDTDTVWSNTRMTANLDGKYLVLAGVTFAANGVGERGLWIRPNGVGTLAIQQQLSVTGADSVGLQVSDLVSLKQGQYVEAMVYQTSGGNLATSGDARCFLAMVYIGE